MKFKVIDCNRGVLKFCFYVGTCDDDKLTIHRRNVKLLCISFDSVEELETIICTKSCMEYGHKIAILTLFVETIYFAAESILWDNISCALIINSYTNNEHNIKSTYIIVNDSKYQWNEITHTYVTE